MSLDIAMTHQEAAQAIKAFAEKLQPREKKRELRKDRDIEREGGLMLHSLILHIQFAYDCV